MPDYKRPPVTEAILEIRLEGPPFDDGIMEKLAARFRDRYPNPPQQSNNFNFEVMGSALRVTPQNFGFRILSADGSFTINVGRNGLGTSKNAPYGGWGEFIDEARTNWSDWEKAVGWKRISRIGLRFINRIDVPFSPTGVTDLEDYFGFNLNAPPSLGPLAKFGITSEHQLPESAVKLTVNFGPVPSPLVETMSFLLDFDFAMERELPSNEKALWEAVEGLRSIKNSVFEACITNKTRELFS